MLQVAETLEFLHTQAHLVHRAISPEVFPSLTLPSHFSLEYIQHKQNLVLFILFLLYAECWFSAFLYACGGYHFYCDLFHVIVIVSTMLSILFTVFLTFYCYYLPTYLFYLLSTELWEFACVQKLDIPISYYRFTNRLVAKREV